ncbi:hypothetical protein [Pseudoclavibacter helvolus]|uniref:hypothetical protein n=1 Tax=Pseudoclavibacter helvolus TaxID=255205 RepID=UPI003C747B2B
MSDDTRAPRQPFDDGPNHEAGTEAGDPRELPDAQDQLEAALARSRGIGEDGDVQSGEVLAGDDVAFDGGAEAPTDPALAPADDVSVAFADPLAHDTTDPNATVGLDRDELAAVLANGPVAQSTPGTPAAASSTDESEAQNDASDESGADEDAAPVPADGGHPVAGDVAGLEAASEAEPEREAYEGAGVDTEPPSGAVVGTERSAGTAVTEQAHDSEQVPPTERVIAEEDDAAVFPATEPVPAHDLAADAIGAESVAAITVDAEGSATAPDDERDAPRRTLEIDRTAARVAAVSSTPPVAAAASPADDDSDASTAETAVAAPQDDAAASIHGVERAEAEVVVTETVTEQLADDGETVEAVTVTERVEVLDGTGTGQQADDGAAASSPAPDAALEHDSMGGGGAAPVAIAAADTADVSSLEGTGTSGDDGPAPDAPDVAPSAATAPAASADDDSTFAPLRLSAPTDSDDLAPVKPKKRGNRMFAVFVALVASVVFAALYLLAFALLRTAFNTGLDPIGEASEFAITAAFTVPVTVFAAFGVLWALIVNRAGWWAYVLGGFLAAALVLCGYYFGAALQQHLADGLPLASIQLDEVLAKFRASEHLLTALVAAIAAREAFTWVGGIAAARGRRVSRANRLAKLGYEKRMAERAAETAAANGESA